jgi:hypothetical protein
MLGRLESLDRDLYEDLEACEWIKKKIQDKTYAQNVYAALCNMRWQPIEVVPILKDEYWSCSWRGAGGIVAYLRGSNEDYMDYYCSGIGDGLGNGDADRTRGYVPEGVVTDEIRNDFEALGWHPSPCPKDKD